MTSIGIFFGSDTGNTENVANLIQQTLNTQFNHQVSEIYDISKSNKKNLESFDILLLGIPTWYYGEAQCDWDDFFPTLKTINFNKKKVALFGCGDQEDYSEYFCDALGILRDIIKPLGATIIGNWPIKGYKFEASKGLINNNNFIGLVIDEDRQPELTNKRVTSWVIQIIQELNIQKK
ncbi:Flavodoxin [Candidatus Ecksteinia adelgidicola]|nr:Flavodoxin [Candidatus Ecksteinia adelgidicola]